MTERIHAGPPEGGHDASAIRIEGDEKVFPDGTRVPLTEYERWERDQAASGTAHDEHTRDAAPQGVDVPSAAPAATPRPRRTRGDVRRDDGRRDDRPDRDRREPDRRRPQERMFSSMGMQVRETREPSGYRYEVLVKDSEGRSRVWEELIDGQRYRVVHNRKVGSAAWELDVPGFIDFREEGSDDTVEGAESGASHEAQLRDMFGENAEQIRMSLNEAYGGYDPDVVNELLRVELAAVGIVDLHDVRTAVGGLRDITGKTADRWPDARERAYLKELMQNKRGLTRVLRELSRTLDRWKEVEDAEWIRLYVSAVTEQVRQGRLSRFLRGPAINPAELKTSLTAMLTQQNQDRAQMRRWLRRTALRGVSDAFLDEVVEDIHRYIHGDDTVEESRAYGMRRHVRYHAEGIQDARGRRR